jgi:Protein of unknown function (DUF3455)
MVNAAPMSFAISRAARAALVLSLAAASFAATATVVSAEQISPPAGASVVREVQGGGAQVYACRAGAGGAYAWALVGPNAILVNDDGTRFGFHGNGPHWTANDGSTVRADGAHPLAVAKHPGGVPDLLLKVVSEQGSGALSAVKFVTRTDSQGGLAPATGCDAAHAGAMAAEHYSAIYTFYR